MADLTPEEKSFVVRHLARQHTPSEVREMLLEEFETDTTTAQLARYNPLCKSGEKLSPQLKAEFEAARAAFEQERETSVMDLHHFRQRERLALYRLAKGKKNVVLAAQLLTEGAKEAGGQYTNKQVLEQKPATAPGPTIDLSRLALDDLKLLQTLVTKATLESSDPGGTVPAQSG